MKIVVDVLENEIYCLMADYAMGVYRNITPLDEMLDKIKAEIEGCENKIRSNKDYDKVEYVAYTDAITDVLEIIDKYKTENEE